MVGRARSGTEEPGSGAAADQFTGDCSGAGGTGPDGSVRAWWRRRCVSGRRAAAGAEVSEVTAGMTGTGTPASTQAWTSS